MTSVAPESATKKLYDAVLEGIARAGSEGPPEAVLRSAVEPALEEALLERGARSRRRAEVHLSVPAESAASALDAPLTTHGRADAIFNRFVIEFEPPGALRPSVMHSATQHAVSQVQQYLRGVSTHSGLPLDRLAGCAFDGTWLVYVTAERDQWNVQRPVRVDETALAALVDTLESLAAGRGLTAENLEEDFGRDSPVAATTVQALTEVLLSDPSPRTDAMFAQWRLDIGNASGFGPASDLPEWVELCSALGVPDDKMSAERVLFALQTYFALVSRMFALVVLEGATGETLLTGLRQGDELWSGLERMESGALTAQTRALNVIEPGIFSWYVQEQRDPLLAALDGLLAAVEEYSAEVVEITPTAARDVFKSLYQRLVPRAIRHRLGEFYTPDWLAAYLLDLVDSASNPLTHATRVLDPSCGSGTFLVEVLRRALLRSGDVDPATVLAAVTRNVVGFDLSPLAVQAARVNYLLAIAPLVRRATEPIVLPVFLADSVSPPRHGGLLEGDVLRLHTAEGEWRVPQEIADEHTLAEMGEAMNSAAAARTPAPDLVSRLRSEMPKLPWRVADFEARLTTLYEKLARVHAEDRDGMWWNLITNALAPTFEGTFDVVVGNPPWVSWETLPDNYRTVNNDLWSLYELHPDAPPGSRQRSGRVRLDLAMLFVARCIDRYLREGGRLAFLITASVFQSELAGRGFRARVVPATSTYAFTAIEDLSRIAVFDDAANRASILIAEKSSGHVDQIPAVLWTPAESGTIQAESTLDDALSLVTRHNIAAEPVNMRDRRSPLLLMPPAALEASRPLRMPSPYLDVIREGINTRGANGILFVDILESGDGWVRVRNDPARGRLRGLPQVEGIVETGAVKRLVRGEDVARGAATSRLGVLFFHDASHMSQPLVDGEAKRRFPKAVAYAREFERFLRSRRQFRNFDPTGDYWLGLYSVTNAVLAQHKVVVREIASELTSAPLNGSDLIPDHKLHVIPCATAAEAERLAYVLNSEVVRRFVHAFAISTSLTGSFLRYVGVRDLSAHDGDMETEEWLAEALGLTVQQLDELASALATMPT